MKTTIKLTIMVCLMFFTTSTFAQEKANKAVKKALDSFVLKTKANSTPGSPWVYNFQNGYEKDYKIVLPQDKMKLVIDLCKVIKQNQKYAYSSMIQEPEGPKDYMNYIEQAYGENDNRIVFANPDGIFYVVKFRDEANSLKRYAYALTWKTDKTDNLTTVNIYENYGLEHIATKKHATEIINRLSNLRFNFHVLKDEKDPTEKSRKQTQIVNQILELCNNSKPYFTYQEKSMTYIILNDMKQDTADEYLQGLLELTAKNMKK